MPPPARLLLLACALAAPALAQQPPSGWHLHTEIVHGEATRLLSTTSADTFPTAGGSPARIILDLPCTTHPTGSITLTADSGDTFAVKSDTTLTLPVRLDDRPVLHAGWANLSPHQVLLYDLRDLLPTHRLMRIDLPLGPGPGHTLTFDLSSLASAMRDNNCRRRIQ